MVSYVSEIFNALEKPQPTVSHHLNILKKAGFLKWRKEGVWVHYSLSNPKITEFLDEFLIYNYGLGNKNSAIP
jgi:DNA-binding transcriptional ArsR family regulator